MSFGLSVGKSCVREQLSGVMCVDGFGYGPGWLVSPWLMVTDQLRGHMACRLESLSCPELASFAYVVIYLR